MKEIPCHKKKIRQVKGKNPLQSGNQFHCIVFSFLRFIEDIQFIGLLKIDRLHRRHLFMDKKGQPAFRFFLHHFVEIISGAVKYVAEHICDSQQEKGGQHSF